jgi:two-component system chemotaxis sensor kinase CheA
VPGVVASVLVQGAKTPEKSAPAMAEATAALGSKSAARAQSGGQSFTENVLRVDAERIDAILNLIGELVIAKSALHQTLSEFSRRFPKDPLRTRLSDAIGFQSQVLNALQRAAMKIRMVPVEHLFRRFPRLVRDLAHRCEKNVTIDIAGQDTDLDKGLLDAITEPLAHLVRNAVDHGIETPAERRAADKPEQGTLRLNAFHQGNQVVIEVSDDGRGIDGRRVLARAVEQGLLTSEQASRLTAADVLDLIFEQGFSTADEITEISGRGVGMDAVKTAVQKLKGTISLETQPGRGTCFQIKLPLTLAILRGMLFRVNDRLYAVPLDSVAEITRAAETDIARVENREVLQLRNEVLTIVRLSRLEQAPEEARTGKLFVLVISAGQRKFGLVVDRLVGEEELVIKPLDDKIVASDLVSGASVLGDGSVVMILNVGELVRRFGTAALPSRPPASQGTTWGATA